VRERERERLKERETLRKREKEIHKVNLCIACHSFMGDILKKSYPDDPREVTHQ
jgi:hypothetical protein